METLGDMSSKPGFIRGGTRNPPTDGTEEVKGGGDAGKMSGGANKDDELGWHPISWENDTSDRPGLTEGGENEAKTGELERRL